MEKVMELLGEAKSVVILLENDLHIQKQDDTMINVVKVIHHLLNDATVIMSKKEDICS